MSLDNTLQGYVMVLTVKMHHGSYIVGGLGEPVIDGPEQEDEGHLGGGLRAV